MARAVVGLFPDRVSAEHAIVDLKAAGFDPQRMGIVMQDRSEAKDVATDQGVKSTTGAVTGSIIGGGLGTILAATGTFVIPGIGPFISGGILATALAGGAAGWLVGGLIGLGIPHEEAQYYQNSVEQGRVLLTVDAQGQDDAARRIMLDNGAEDTGKQPWADRGTMTSAATPMMGTPGTVNSRETMDAQRMRGAQPAATPEYMGEPPADTRQTMDREMLSGTRFRDDRGDAVVDGEPMAPGGQRALGNDTVTNAPHGTFPDDEAARRAQLERERDQTDMPRNGPIMDQDIIAERDARTRE